MKFTVIDPKTGDTPDLEQIALSEEWAKHLISCDVEGFALREDGILVLYDECGNLAYCPTGRFRIQRDRRAEAILKIFAKYADSLDLAAIPDRAFCCYLPMATNGVRAKRFREARELLTDLEFEEP